MAINSTGTKVDALDSMVRRYLTVDGELHVDAYNIVKHWYNYLTTYFNTVGHQMPNSVGLPTVGVAAVDSAFMLPIMGLPGNLLWQAHGGHILTLIVQDLRRDQWMRKLAKKGHADMAFMSTFTARFEFIGFVVSLVQQQDPEAQVEFEVEFRELMKSLSEKALKVN